MTKKSTDQFYTDLPTNEIPLNQLIASPWHFHPLPEDWSVIITDIKNSTQAIEEGRHQLVNLVAAGSIIAGINITRKAGLTIPFFFGGDGATLLVPSSLENQLVTALLEHRDNTMKNFGLDLRVGQLAVSEIYHQHQKLTIAKAKRSHEFNIPVILGSGLQYAESQVKAADSVQTLPAEHHISLDLTGMECRWDQIEPPETRFEVVSMLIVAQDTKKQSGVFKKVLDVIDQIYGVPQARNPISPQKLRLKTSFNRIETETLAKIGRIVPGYLIANWLMTLFGKIYIRFDRAGKYYLKRLVELSDTLVLDGRINTVITGTIDQRKQLVAHLVEMERKDQIFFGWHASKQSVMSCYVRDRRDQHIHFIDGSEGGYTRAASMLKSKI
ncbi:MAG: hypothetical protein DHS20C17_29200 [Cyclobacteriaceae bacterium]|nr:MAG: hypothetical protein DHS20C17_29200 [Cyclobacteriaceae bacterium]